MLRRRVTWRRVPRRLRRCVTRRRVPRMLRRRVTSQVLIRRHASRCMRSETRHAPWRMLSMRVTWRRVPRMLRRRVTCSWTACAQARQERSTLRRPRRSRSTPPSSTRASLPSGPPRFCCLYAVHFQTWCRSSLASSRLPSSMSGTGTMWRQSWTLLSRSASLPSALCSSPSTWRLGRRRAMASCPCHTRRLSRRPPRPASSAA